MDYLPQKLSERQSQNQEEGSADQSAKDTFYKEEFMNQLKLVDVSIQSPSHLLTPMTLNFMFSHQESLGVSEGLPIFGSKLSTVESMDQTDAQRFESAYNQVGTFLNDLLEEQNAYNYHRKSVAKQVKKSIADDITNFCTQLVEKKRNLPRVLHEIPTSTLGIQLNDLQTQEALSLKKKEESLKDKSDIKDSIITEKLEWIRLKKKIEFITDLNPLTMNIETIYTLPENIKVADEDGTVPDKQPLKSKPQLFEIENEMKSEFKGLDLETIMKDKMEQGFQVSTKDTINPGYVMSHLKGTSIVNFNQSLTQPSQQQTEPSHQSLNIMDQTEIIDINFYRDLAPASRRLAQPLNCTNNQLKRLNKERRLEQKRILNELIEIEPNQANIDEDMYLLALSNQVPIDCLIKRMHSIGKWEIKDKNIQTLIYKSSSSSSLNSQHTDHETLEGSRINAKIQRDNLLDLKKNLSPDQNSKGKKGSIQSKRPRISSEVVDVKNVQSIKDMKQGLKDVKQSVDDLLKDQIQQRVQDFKIEEYDLAPRTERFTQNRQKSTQEQSHSSSNERHFGIKKQQKFGEQLSIISEHYSANEDISMTQNFLKNFKKLTEDKNKQTTGNQIVDIRLHNGYQKQKNPDQKRMSEFKVKFIAEECETLVTEKLKQIEDLKHAKQQIDTSNHEMLTSKKKQNSNLIAHTVKNNEKMKREINKRIEQHLTFIVQILDQKTQEALTNKEDLEDEKFEILTTETILRASQIGNDDEIDEQVKAKFLARLVREFCNNKERQKQLQLREQMEKEIESNIYKRFPGLSNSPPSMRQSDKMNLTKRTMYQSNYQSPGKSKYGTGIGISKKAQSNLSTVSSKAPPLKKVNQFKPQKKQETLEVVRESRKTPMFPRSRGQKKLGKRPGQKLQQQDEVPPDEEWIGADDTDDFNTRDNDW